MYTHPISVQSAVTYHQQELLRDASQSQLAKEARGERGSQQILVITTAVAVLLGLLVFAV